LLHIDDDSRRNHRLYLNIPNRRWLWPNNRCLYVYLLAFPIFIFFAYSFLLLLFSLLCVLLPTTVIASYCIVLVFFMWFLHSVFFIFIDRMLKVSIPHLYSPTPPWKLPATCPQSLQLIDNPCSSLTMLVILGFLFYFFHYYM